MNDYERGFDSKVDPIKVKKKRKNWEKADCDTLPNQGNGTESKQQKSRIPKT